MIHFRKMKVEFLKMGSRLTLVEVFHVTVVAKYSAMYTTCRGMRENIAQHIKMKLP